MSRLIDADELMSQLRRGHIIYEDGTENFGYTTLVYGSVIKNAPTVDAKPTIYAHWIYHKDHWECSNCGGNRFHDLVLGLDAQYCSRCGAKMDIYNIDKEQEYEDSVCGK